MTRVPVITSPCPLRWASMPRDGRDHCGHCDRRVHNLDGMGASQREAFLAGCQGKVCVAYTVHARRQRRNVALGAGLLAAMAGSTAMAGEEAIGFVPLPMGETSPVDTGSGAVEEELLELVFVGGIDDPRGARWADEDDVTPEALDEPAVIAESDWLPSAPE